jgi:hypothetical protein
MYARPVLCLTAVGAKTAPDRHTLYLLAAAACLVVALTFLKRALAPIGVAVRVVAAALVVAVAVAAALAFLAAAAVAGP